MFRGPAHGPRVDVAQLAACARARGALVTLAILEELLLAMPHRRRDGAVVPCRDEVRIPDFSAKVTKLSAKLTNLSGSRKVHYSARHIPAEA